MSRSILLCCRGEIAHRFTRTCRVLGFKTIQLYTAEEAGAEFVLAADSAIQIDSWRPDQLAPIAIASALEAGADAIAPGYGALAENADFAAACAAARLTFIGPAAQAIARTGDKIAARAAAQAAGVPVVPGDAVSDDQAQARLLADGMGYPVLIKAALGGGGRGIRVVLVASEFAQAFEEVKREAQLAFGSAQLYIERFLGETVRHVEVQVLGDTHGNLVHLGTRECSVQRRRQKIVEEAPAPNLSDAVRERIHRAALAMAHEVGYDSAGTVEFLVDANEQFYFIEMNARIQVEHPVSEAITGLDLVAEMLRAAFGEALSVTQADIRFSGHAIEFRICSEDAHAGFMPTGGQVTAYRAPAGPGIRVDAGVHLGALQSAQFDSLCLKLIAHGSTRDIALRRGAQALAELRLEGFSSNIPFHRWLLADAAFQRGVYDLATTQRFTDHSAIPAPTLDALHVAAALALQLGLSAADAVAAADGPALSPWVLRHARVGLTAF